MPSAQNGWSINSKAREEFTVTYPKVYLEEIRWSNEANLVTDNVGDKEASEWATALSISRSAEGLADIVSTFSRFWTGWQPVLNRTLSGSRVWTGLDTTFDESHFLETLSVSGTQVWDVFQWLRHGRHSLGKNSTGWTGNLTLVVPVLNSMCKACTSDTNLPQNTVTVNVPYEQLSDRPSLTIDLGSIPTHNFPGARCTFTFRQALHSFSMWIIDMNTPDVSQNQYWRKFNESLIYQPTLAQDFTMALALAVHAAGVLTYKDRLMSQDGMLKYLLLMSPKLQADIPTITSDAHGLTFIMGVLLQNMISYSDSLSPQLPAELSSDPNEVITSYPIQWQIYGSGPRLAWEWAVVFVLVVISCCFCFGLWQTVWYRMAPGEWTELSGMMMVAQATVPKLTDIDDEKKASKMLYAVAGEKETMLWSWKDDRVR